MTSSLLTCFTHNKSPPPLRGMQIIGGRCSLFLGIALALHGDPSSSSLMFGLKLHAIVIPACFRSEICLRTSHKLLPLQWQAKKLLTMFNLDSGRAYVPLSLLEAKSKAAMKWPIAEHDGRLLTAMASLGRHALLQHDRICNLSRLQSS